MSFTTEIATTQIFRHELQLGMNLESLICMFERAARSRVQLGKSQDKTNLQMLICKVKFGVASRLWAITQQGRERTQSPPKRKRMAQKRPVR